MGSMTETVALTAVLPESKDSVPGREDDRLRVICLPYASAVTLQDLSIPVDPRLLEVQVKTANGFVFTITPKIKERLQQSEPLRREALQPTIRVWGRLIRTCLFYKEMYPEEEMTAITSGKARLQVPQLPKNPARGLFNSGQAPEGIKDPQARKEYEAYLKSAQDVRNRFIAARQVSQLRSQELYMLRKKLEYLYGEDRKTWDELRQVVTDTIPDPKVAQLVIKDFTRRKEPGLWP